MGGSDESVSYSYIVSLLFSKQKSTKRTHVMEISTQNKRPLLEFGCGQTPKPIRSSLDYSTDRMYQRISKT